MSELLTKDLAFANECQEHLVNGVSKLSRAVKSTLGVFGSTVLIESVHHTHGIVNTKDGVTVAKSINLLHPIENLGASVVKEAAEKTATSSGDGTTTSIVLAEALILAGIEHISETVNKTQVLRELSNAANDVVSILEKDKLDCTDDILLDVAKISCNNDERIGGIIAEAYKGVGKDGIVTVERSPNEETTFKVINGLKIERGYSSPLFAEAGKEECVMEDVSILVCDTEITTPLQLPSIFETISRTGKKLLIIAPCSSAFISASVYNSKQGQINMCIIQPPNFGYKRQEQMEDIALAVGAKCFSEKTGDDLSLIKFSDLGFADKVIVERSQTIVVGGKCDEDKVKKTAENLRESLKNRTAKHEIDYINERVASLIGGVGVIYVGGNTDLEQKELYDRAEDAVCAVRSAMEEGIVSGAGKALWEVTLPIAETKEREIANTILLQAIKEPLCQILRNADLKADAIYSKDKLAETTKGYGYDLKNDKYGNLIEMGVIDPFKVTKNALLNAVSVATTILSTNTTVTITRA